MYSNPILNLLLEILRYVAFALCTLFNGMLLRMISMPRHSDLGSYRFLLLAFVSADIVYGFVHFLVVPVPESYKNAFVMGGHGTWSSRYGVGLVWPLVFSLAFPMLSFNFAYRLVAVKYPFHLELFKTPRVIGCLVAIAAGNCLTWSAISRYTGFDDVDSQLYTRDFFSSNGSLSTYMHHNLAEMNDYIVVVFWDRGFLHGLDCNNFVASSLAFLDGFHWINSFGAATMGLIGSIAYSFMAYAALNILHYLHKNAQWSERFHRQHVQLFRALVLQALTPFMTSYIPLGLCGILPFLGADFPLFSVLVPPLCAFHPVLDAIIMVVTVSQFRNTLMDWCRRAPRRPSRVVVVVDHEEVNVERIGMRKLTVSPTQDHTVASHYSNTANIH